MANLLSGISAGTHQGLASLVASKRQNRQIAREQRRYEDQMMLQLSNAQAERQYRDKVFAYQKTRDDIGDQQWADTMGIKRKQVSLEADRVAETKRSNLVRETQAAEATRLADEDRDEQIAQTWEQIGQRQIEHEDTLAALLRQEETEQTRHEAEMAFKTGQQDDLNAYRRGTLAAEMSQQKTMRDYYQGLIDVQRDKLNQPMSELEIEKIQAEINRLNAQKALYEAQAENVGKGDTTYKPIRPTWTQGRDLAAEVAGGYAEEFSDRGDGEFTWSFFGKDVHPGFAWEKVWPLFQSKSFPYDEASGGKPGEPTQVSEMQRLGGEAFERLWRQTGDVQLAMQQLDELYDALLKDPNFGEKARNYMSAYGPPNAEQELRQYFLRGGLEAIQRLRGGTQPTAPTTGSPSENIQLPERY